MEREGSKILAICATIAGVVAVVLGCVALGFAVTYPPLLLYAGISGICCITSLVIHWRFSSKPGCPELLKKAVKVAVLGSALPFLIPMLPAIGLFLAADHLVGHRSRFRFMFGG